MGNKKKATIPAPSVPPNVVEVVWMDANYETEHDGPVSDLKQELLPCPHIGYHIKNDVDKNGHAIVILGGSAWDEEGVLHSRFHMVIPRRHIVSFRVVERGAKK